LAARLVLVLAIVLTVLVPARTSFAAGRAEIASDLRMVDAKRPSEKTFHHPDTKAPSIKKDGASRHSEPDSLQQVAGMRGGHAATVPAQDGDRSRVSPAAIIGLGLAFASSAIALGIAFGIRRRIDRLVPPPDDEEE
jgi:hypothetical protein